MNEMHVVELYLSNLTFTRSHSKLHQMTAYLCGINKHKKYKGKICI